jgi:hypothetical protein
MRPAGSALRKTDGLSEHSVAYYGNRVVRPPAEPRRTTLKRALSWALVCVVHLLFLSMLTISMMEEEQRVGRKSAIETILDLSLLRNPNAPRIDIVKPDVQSRTPPEVTTAPITIPPPKPIPEENPPPAPATPGDVLKAVGEAIACGASNFENLTEAQQAHCRHEPWIPRKLPNGTIVLDAPPKVAEQPQLHMSGADQMRHDMQTAPGCPIMLQTPCVDDMFTGRNSRP